MLIRVKDYINSGLAAKDLRDPDGGIHLARNKVQLGKLKVVEPDVSPVPELSFLPAPYRGSTQAGERRVQDNLHAHAQSEPIKNY